MQFPWPHQVNAEYTSALRARLSEAVIVATATVSIGEWMPQPNQCHENVTVWCTHNQAYEVVRGWLYMDMAGQLAYEVFLAHSVVRDHEGRLWDITPRQASQAYPFLAAVESEEEYGGLVGQGATRLVHYN